MEPALRRESEADPAATLRRPVRNRQGRQDLRSVAPRRDRVERGRRHGRVPPRPRSRLARPAADSGVRLHDRLHGGVPAAARLPSPAAPLRARVLRPRRPGRARSDLDRSCGLLVGELRGTPRPPHVPALPHPLTGPLLAGGHDDRPGTRGLPLQDRRVRGRRRAHRARSRLAHVPRGRPGERVHQHSGRHLLGHRDPDHSGARQSPSRDAPRTAADVRPGDPRLCSRRHPGGTHHLRGPGCEDHPRRAARGGRDGAPRIQRPPRSTATGTPACRERSSSKRPC